MLNMINNKHYYWIEWIFDIDMLHFFIASSFKHDQHDNYSWVHAAKYSLIFKGLFMKSYPINLNICLRTCQCGLQKYFCNSNVRSKFTTFHHAYTAELVFFYYLWVEFSIYFFLFKSNFNFDSCTKYSM